jgi:predicted phage terminase large subunit-like protein
MKPKKTSLVAIEREIGLRGSFYDFVKMAWPVVEPSLEFRDNWHIKLICEHYEAATRGELRLLAVNLPPGGMKSLLTCVFWPCWAWIREPGLRWIFVSFDQSLTNRDSKKSLQLICSEWYQKRWGDKVEADPTAAIGDHSNTAGGWRFATSVDGKMTGRHADIIVVDDPIKPLEVNKKAIEHVLEWWTGTVPTRLRDQATGRKIIIMQRLHEMDLVGYVLRNERGWEHLRLPMRFEPSAPSATRLGRDPRTEEGELFWPSRFPETSVLDLEKNLGSRGTAAQLQQRPSPEDGAVFQREWLSNRWAQLPEKFEKVIQSWDLTFKDGDGTDYVVGQVWGVLGPNFYLLDQVRGRKDFPNTLVAIKALSKKWPRAITKIIEDKANGPAVASVLRETLSGIIMVQPEGGKLARANAVAPLFEAGNVLLPEKASWIEGYIEELLTFPVGQHDDQVDASTQALTFLFNKTSKFIQAMKRVKEGGFRIS